MAKLSNFFADSVGDVTIQEVTDPREMPISVGNAYIKDWTSTHEHASATNFWFQALPTFLQMYNDEWTTVYTDQAWNNPNPTQAGVVDKYYKATNNSEILGGYLVYDPVTDVNSYATVCSHTGTGILTNVIGLGNVNQPSGTATYIKITVDGNVYEFKSFLDYHNDNANSNHERLIWGHTLIGTNDTTSPHSGGPWAGNHGDYGTGRQNRTRFMKFHKDTMIMSTGEQTHSIVNPYHFNSYRGFIGLRFNSSLIVEVKNEPVAGATQTTTNFANYAAALIKRDIITT